MIEESRQTLQLSVGFLVTPALDLSAQRFAALQTRLEEEGVRFQHAERQENAVFLVRQEPSALHVQITNGNLPGPEAPPVTQFVVLTAATPEAAAAEAAEFADVAHEITDVARDVWPEMEHVLGWSTAVRALFASSTEHSFQYLWEQRLRQPGDSLALFGRPIVGGGFRVLMAPGAGEDEQFQAEVKVESLLEDPRQLYLELDLGSTAPAGIAVMNPTTLVNATEDFLQGRVIPFLRA